MAKKGLYYAVTGSEHSGVFASYGEAQKCMRGQANAVVRKFMTREAAEYYLRTGKTLQFYVVKRGHHCGIFSNYNDFAKQVYKYPGAVFQKFDWLPFAKLYYDLPDSSRVWTKKDGGKDGLLEGVEIVDGRRSRWGRNTATVKTSTAGSCISAPARCAGASASACPVRTGTRRSSLTRWKMR